MLQVKLLLFAMQQEIIEAIQQFVKPKVLLQQLIRLMLWIRLEFSPLILDCFVAREPIAINQAHLVSCSELLPKCLTQDFSEMNLFKLFLRSREVCSLQSRICGGDGGVSTPLILPMPITTYFTC